MKLLFLAPAYPWPLDSGWTQRSHHVLDALARRHEVTLFTVDDAHARGRGRSPLEARCARVVVMDTGGRAPTITRPERGRPTRRYPRWFRIASFTVNDLDADWCRDVIAALRTLRRRERFDAVWACQLEIAEFAARAGFRRIVVDVDDVPSAVLERRLAVERSRTRAALGRLKLARLRLLERLLPRRFFRLVVSKPEDRARCPGAYVVPNGIDPAPLLPGTGGAELIFVGNLHHPPNVDAIGFFLDEVLPRVRRAVPETTFTVVGKGENPRVLERLARAGCRAYPSAPDLEPHYARAAVVVAPLRLGSGTKLKVLEALARGKAVVATSVGAEGIRVRPGVDLEVADDPEAFAAACVRLLSDPAARVRLGRSGRERVVAGYSWPAIEPSIEKVLARRPGA